jgi:hypothetical protein
MFSSDRSLPRPFRTSQTTVGRNLRSTSFAPPQHLWLGTFGIDLDKVHTFQLALAHEPVDRDDRDPRRRQLPVGGTHNSYERLELDGMPWGTGKSRPGRRSPRQRPQSTPHCPAVQGDVALETFVHNRHWLKGKDPTSGLACPASSVKNPTWAPTSNVTRAVAASRKNKGSVSGS